MSEYIPQEKAWLVFDLSNGHRGKCQYVWWFHTRREAREHIKYARQFPNAASLSAPMLWVPAEKKAKNGKRQKTTQK